MADDETTEMLDKIQLARISAEERSHSRGLQFAAFAMVILAGLVGFLIYLGQTNIAVGMAIAMAVYASVLLGQRLQLGAVQATLRAEDPDKTGRPEQAGAQSGIAPTP